MGVISACWREAVHGASVSLAAAVMNEAVCEHEKNTVFGNIKDSPKYFDFVFLQFWGWWFQSVAAVAAAANNQRDWKRPVSF